MVVTGAAPRPTWPAEGSVRSLTGASISQAVGGKFGAPVRSCSSWDWPAVLASLRLRDQTARQATAFYGLLVSAGAFVAFGHALVSPERWLSTPADVVHVVFAAMWFGGLIGLVVVLRSRVARHAGPERWPRPTSPLSFAEVQPVPERRCRVGRLDRRAGAARTADVRAPPVRWRWTSVLAGTIGLVDRFSTMAGISIALVLVAGTLLAIAEVGSVANLFETGYGQTLLVKIALVGLLIIVAAYNRLFLVPWLSSAAARVEPGGPAAGWRRLLATVRLEAVAAVAILAVTAVLANGVPSNGATPGTAGAVCPDRAVRQRPSHLPDHAEPGAGQQHHRPVHRRRQVANRPTWRRACPCT